MAAYVLSIPLLPLALHVVPGSTKLIVPLERMPTATGVDTAEPPLI